MKVLGISSGRRLGNSEILLREALAGAKGLGAEAELVRLNEFEINPCEGCSGCEQKPHGIIDCVRHKDDFPVLMEKIYEADAVILASPIYTWTPNGLMRVLGDRIGPYHDVEMLRLKGYEREDSPIDQRVFKRRVGAYITVGGSKDVRYSSMALPMMNQVMYPLALTIVDQMEVHGAYMPGQCVDDREALARARKLGENVVCQYTNIDRQPTNAVGQSANAVKQSANGADTPQWCAEVEQLCPECHNHLFAMYPDEKKVYCGNCAIVGELVEGENGTTNIIFMPEARAKSRFRLSKMGEHAKFIVGGQSVEVKQARREMEKGALEKEILKYRTYTPALAKRDKKVVGISFGTRNGNSETLTKAALMGAEAAGAQVELIRFMDYKIKPCIGCLQCTQEGRLGKCIYEDDFDLLMEHIYTADGVIFASPMYSWGPTDAYRILCDRLNAGHNIAYLKKMGADGCPEMFDQRVFKSRPAGMITVGGTKEETKTVTTVPLMHVLTYGMRMHVIDHVICKDTGAPGGVLAYPEKVEHAYEMGKHIVETCGLPEEKMTWMGDAGGLCPHCHNDLVNFRTGTDTFTCAVCGVSGKLTWKGGRLTAQICETEDNRPIQTEAKMHQLLDEFAQLEAQWEKNKDAAETTGNKYENYPVPAFRLK